MLYRQKAQYDGAIRAVQAGPVREPQNVYYQILLGELYRERGGNAQALKHFRELLDSGVPTTEERLVLKIKIDRLTAAPAAPARRLDLADQPLYSGLSFGVVPLNVSDAAISWPDICRLLESKWLVPCEVLPPVTLDERPILDERRQQYDANQILNELERRYPTGKRAHKFIVAVTGRDIFGTETNFVFSWQDGRTGAGVISTYRFVADLEDFYERSIVATHRLGIQFISTTGFLLGFARPTRPDCPLAYPHDFREFLMKSSKLCEQTIQERDALLKRAGGAATRFGTSRADEINRVYRGLSLRLAGGKRSGHIPRLRGSFPRREPGNHLGAGRESPPREPPAEGRRGREGRSRRNRGPGCLGRRSEPFRRSAPRDGSNIAVFQDRGHRLPATSRVDEREMLDLEEGIGHVVTRAWPVSR
jgi:predicted Zn-dependent protease